MSYVSPKTEQSANKELKKSINTKRYKFFLENVKNEREKSLDTAKMIHLYAKNFGISRQSLYKYRNKAIKDGILKVHTLGVYKDPNSDNIYFTTYSIKRHIATFYEVDIEKLTNMLESLKNVNADWATNHRYEAYERYLIEKRNQKIIKNLKGFKKGTENYESARVDAHLFTKKIAFNPEKVKEVLNLKYPFVKDLQKDVEYINTFLPDDLKNRFDFKIKPTNSGKFIKGISIRITNNSCGSISHEKALANLTNSTYKRTTKKELLSKYNLLVNPNNDTKSSILRISESLRRGEWLDESHDCYSEILDAYIGDEEGLTLQERNEKIKLAREYFKPLTLSLFFAGSYKMAVKNLYRNVDIKSAVLPKYNNLFCSFCPEDWTTDSVEAEDYMKYFLKEIAKEFYLYLGAKEENGQILGHSLSNEVFLWESMLTIKMMKYLIDLHKDDEVKPIIWQQYDALYTNFKVDNFRELRKKIFMEEVLPIYKKYTCYK